MTQMTAQHHRHALWLLTSWHIHRYLMSCTQGRFSPGEKAGQHQELCKTFVAAYFAVEKDDARMHYEDQYQAVHSATQDALTDRMDEVIGFPTEDRRPDYDALAPKFFAVFYDTAMMVLATGPQERSR